MKTILPRVKIAPDGFAVEVSASPATTANQRLHLKFMGAQLGRAGLVATFDDLRAVRKLDDGCTVGPASGFRNGEVMNRRHAAIPITTSLLTISLLACTATMVDAAPAKKFPSVSAALSAADAAKTEDERSQNISAAASIPIESEEDVTHAYYTLKRVGDGLKSAKDDRNSKEQAATLHHILERATAANLRPVVARLLEQDAADIPAGYLGPIASLDRDAADRETIRVHRLAALIQASGDGKNDRALQTLRALSTKGGLPADLATKAIASIGKSEDLDRFISEIKANPKARVDMTGFGPMVIDRIMKEVDDPTVPEDQKNRLIARLGHGNGPGAAEKYAALLHHKNPKVARMAARSIAIGATADSERVITNMLADSDAEVRFHGLVALEDDAWNSAYSPTVIQLLRKDSYDGVRAEAAHVLGLHKVKAAEADLKGAMNDPSPRVREAADGALKWLSGEYEERIRRHTSEILKKQSR